MAVPYNIEHEKKVLGSIFLNSEHYYIINEILKPNHFYEDIHKEILISVNKLKEKSLTPTKELIANMLSITKKFDEQEIEKYVDQLIYIAEAIIDPVPYALIIKDLYVRRQLIDFANKIKDTAQHASLEIRGEEQINQAEETLYNIAVTETTSNEFVHIKNTVPLYLNKLDESRRMSSKFVGIPCNIFDIDTALGGFRNSDLVIVAARPGMGKTAFALNIALGISKNIAPHEAVGIFSLEMSKDQLCSRLLSILSGINSHNISNCQISDDQFNVLLNCSHEMNNLNIFIDDSAALSIAAIRSRARRLARKANLKFLIIDYLQLLHAEGKSDNRVVEVSKITQGLKQIAKELNIPVVALSQLSRSVESRTDNRPVLSDLRESGSIEQDADIVMFLYREEYYMKLKNKDLLNSDSEDLSPQKLAELEEKANRCKNIAEVIIAKHRNGATQNIHLFHDSSTFSFKNLNERSLF